MAKSHSVPKGTMSSSKPAPAPAPQPAPAAPAPQAVALRGGLVATTVTVTAKPYRCKAVHNQNWWAAITKAAASGPANVQALVKAGVPAHFIGYGIRRGYLSGQ